MSLAPWRRHLVLACFCAGLALSPAQSLSLPPGSAPVLVVAAALLAIAAVPLRAPAAALAVAACALALPAGLCIGGARLDAIDAGALRAGEGERVRARGFVVTPPRPLAGATRFALETPDGRIGVAVDEPVEGLAVGARIAVGGSLQHPDPWLAGLGRRAGWALELQAGWLETRPGSRPGPTGLLDRARTRAEAGLTAGLHPARAALASGLVLGQDEAIDPLVRDDFQRSGLAHLLAASGQNVILLAVLAGVLLAALGLPPRLRLALIIAAIAAYVPIAGGGPSIQRAAVMGIAGILAGLLGRATDRAWIVLLAAAVTLLLSPLAAGDVGWQLSFAAVIGIGLWSHRLAALIGERLAGPPGAGRRHPSRDVERRSRAARARLARPLAEAIALTASATLATGPLIAHVFGTVSLASLPANLLVAPLVAPVMWLGMLAAGLGQLPLIPTEPLTALLGPLLDLTAAIAHALAAPGWASLTLPEPGAPATAAIYAAMLAGMPALLGALERRRRGRLRATLRLALTSIAALLVLGLLAGRLGGADRAQPPAHGTLRITAVDVGQGDAVLLQQQGRAAILIDAGPPGAGIAGSIRDLGVDELAALIVTHDHLDHYGGAREVVDAMPVGRLLIANPVSEAASAARIAGIPVRHVAAGSAVEQGQLRLDVLSPPHGAPPPADPNEGSVVIRASFGPWSALLPGDAEQEATHLQPGPFDVLKVAHHGSADAELGNLLDTSSPRLALIDVGTDNDYGHPDAETLTTLAQHKICTLRTDLDGNVGTELGPNGLTAFAENGIDPTRPGCEGLG